MKYKVGDEVLVKVRIHHIVNQKTDLPYEVKAINNGKIEPRTIWIREEDIQSDSPMTAEEAWEIAGRIILPERCGGLSSKEIRHIFGDVDVEDIIKDFSPQQAKAKIEAWEAEKEIKVGDEVVVKSDPYNDDCKFFVTHMNYRENEISGVSGFDGGVFYGRKTNQYQKTGRHIDINGILKQIGGTDA